MPTGHEESDIYLEIENQMNVLKQMQGELKYDLNPIKQQSLLEAAAKKIPMLSKFLRKLDSTGDAVVKVGEQVDFLHDTKATESISHGFHFGGIAMAAFDFLRIPLIYLAAFILKEKIPLTLNNNAKWLYAGIVLGLSITALAAPVTAPVIAFVIAGISLVASSFLLGKILYEQYQLNRQSKRLQKELRSELNEMDLIQQDATHLEKSLGEAHDEEHIAVIYQEIAVLKERFDSQKECIEAIKNKQLQLEQKKQSIKTTQVMDRSIGILLAALSIIGLVLALYFPPIGLGILAGVAIAGGAYVVARITFPLVKMMINWITGKFKAAEVIEEEKQLFNDVRIEEQHIHESTADVFNSLKKEGPAVPAMQPTLSNDETVSDIKLKEHPHKKSLVGDSIFAPRDNEKDGEEEVKEGEGRTDVEIDHP